MAHPGEIEARGDAIRRHRLGELFSLRAARREAGPVLAGTVLPFILILYLALRGGGYDAVVRSEVGVAIWWIVVLGAIVGVLPSTNVPRRLWIALAGLCAFAAWTAIGLIWSESQERTVAELARVATYAGVFALALNAYGRDAVRRTVYSVGAALAVIGALALLSRLHPPWFPANETGKAFEIAVARLNYPVDYWNALAALMAIGTPLLLAIAVNSRRIATQALATASVPVMALVAFYTLSRGGAIEIGVALVAFVVLSPKRLQILPSVALAGLGGAMLIVAATQRTALKDGLSTQAALDQGNEMIAIVLVVCTGVALLRAAFGLAERHRLLPQPRLSRRATGRGLAVLLVVAIAAAAAIDLPGRLSESWEGFKESSPAAGDTAGRFESASGNGRYQYWSATVDAAVENPLTGIGPGTWEFYWAREGSLPGFVRDAHSLFFEALGELGVPGLLLISGFIFGVIGFGIRRAFAAPLDTRPWIAAATAACIAFATAAAVDWAWEMALIPIVFLLLAAAILAARDPKEDGSPNAQGPRPRIVLGVLGALALAAIGIPLIGTKAVRASQDDVNAGEVDSALEQARTAGNVQPWAATPPLQQALVLELQGGLGAAAEQARQATRREPTNWRTWYVLSQIEEAQGDREAARAAYDRARELNPRSALFSR